MPEPDRHTFPHPSLTPCRHGSLLLFLLLAFMVALVMPDRGHCTGMKEFIAMVALTGYGCFLCLTGGIAPA
jgi:hypothetical protein